MNADALGDESPILTLLGRCIAQSWKPFQRRRDFASVGEGHNERVSGETDAEREQLHFAAALARDIGDDFAGHLSILADYLYASK